MIRCDSFLCNVAEGNHCCHAGAAQTISFGVPAAVPTDAVQAAADAATEVSDPTPSTSGWGASFLQVREQKAHLSPCHACLALCCMSDRLHACTAPILLNLTMYRFS